MHSYHTADRNFKFSQISRAANYQYRHFEKSICQIHYIKVRKEFLNECKLEQVLPQSLKIDLKADFSPFHDVKRAILDDRIKALNYDLESEKFKSRRFHRNLKCLISPQILKQMENNAHNFSRFKAGIRRNNLMRKMDTLRTMSRWYEFTMPENVINMSSRNLSFFEKHCLGLGLTFNLPPTQKDTISVAASFEKLIYNDRDNRIGNKDLIRGIVSPLLLSIKKGTPWLPKSLHCALQNLENDRSIRIMAADKGGKVVVMDKSMYDSKIENLLDDVQTYEKLKDNPLVKVNKFIRSTISEISKSCPDPSLLKKFLIPNCNLSYLYGIPKLHKDGCPLRPIVSNVGTATRSLAGWLAKILTPYLGSFSDAHLKNSIHFKNKMVEFAQNNSTNIGKLVSLDVSSLFTKVPTDIVIEFLTRKIESNQISLPIPKDQFLQLIGLCVNNNYFQYENSFYKQKFGISMGSPLSPVLANLFMEFFESELLPTLPVQPPLWVRYVDDILIFWPDELDFQEFFHGVNNLVPSIKFTVEWEEGGKISFLDTMVYRRTSGFSTAVYRKPTHSNQFLHYYSWHPDHIKRSSLFSLLLRAYRLSDHPFLDQELNYLRQAFQRVGFPDHVFEEVHSRVKRKFYSRDPTPNQEEEEPARPLPTISLPHNDFSQTFVKPVFSANGVRVVNPSSNTLRRNLVKNKPSKSGVICDAMCSGVYTIPCKNCSSSYYGETGRSFVTRLEEHKRAVRNGYSNYATFKHVAATGHDLDWAESRLIFKSNDWYSRLVVESSCINSCHNVLDVL